MLYNTEIDISSIRLSPVIFRFYTLAEPGIHDDLRNLRRIVSLLHPGIRRKFFPHTVHQRFPHLGRLKPRSWKLKHDRSHQNVGQHQQRRRNLFSPNLRPNGSVYPPMPPVRRWGLDFLFKMNCCLFSRTLPHHLARYHLTAVVDQHRQFLRVHPALIVVLPASRHSAAWKIFPPLARRHLPCRNKGSN